MNRERFMSSRFIHLRNLWLLTMNMKKAVTTERNNSVDTLIRRWTLLSNQRWIVRHYLLTRLTHSIRLIIIISIWWLDESFQLTIHSRINNHLIDHIISRFYIMTFNDYVTNRIFNMWAKYLTCEEIENHLYKTLCNHLIKIIHHL
jgi:hypothetical protein